MDPRFLVDARGALSPADGQSSPLSGRTGYYRLQPTSPDWVLLLRSPAQGGTHEARPRVVLAGDCAAFPLADLVAFLGQSRWTGVLRVASQACERSLLLREGDVRSAASDAPTDRIGEVMVRLGYVSRAQLNQVLAEAPPSRIGRALVDRGVLKPHDLFKCLNEQIGEIFHGIMLVREGAFALIDQQLDEKALSHNLSLSVQGLLMDSIRKIDELAQFRKRIPHGRVYVVPRKPSDGDLEPEEAALLEHVTGERTIIELGQATRTSEFDATRVVHRLLELGLVKLSESPGVASSPTLAPTFTPPSPAPVVPAAPPSAPRRGAPGTSAAAPSLQPSKVLQVFNTIFREVRDEVAARGTLEPFLIAANAALLSSGVSASPVLTGLAFGDDGLLNEPDVLARYAQLSAEGQLGVEPVAALKQALSDVMFFLLFQAGELLEATADEDLARRVKVHLAQLEPK